MLIRSIGAVVAGFLVVVILSIGTDVALRAAGIFPPLDQRVPDALLLVATAYRTLYSIAGSYIASRLAPSHPMRHALALGVLGFAASTAGAIATWNGGPAFDPKWYPIALIVLAMPGAWVGGKLYGRR